MFEYNLKAFLAGATAGLCVDVSLFPIDTIKTRIQSAQHSIQRVPGNQRLFAGLPAVLVGSAPGAAVFFLTYELVKNEVYSLGMPPIFSSVSAACLAEVAACVVRVPCEVLKQRAQNSPHLTMRVIFSRALNTEGVFGLYRGYLSTALREIPFSFIQFPIWEHLKLLTIRWNQRHQPQGQPVSGFANPHELHFWQSALCGSLSGAIAGALTTPLDVAKTRIMLAEAHTPLASGNIVTALKTVFRELGLRGLFSGIVPRVSYLALGGAIFLGMYDTSYRLWNRVIHTMPSESP
ncbi:S-adenosylmethionine carrier protein [Clonorchis sinensis]|uniref:S-adenosylmethionine carrier protein n=1 Tax=Clonorchis sinensis TaxID=79923 RepID=A0A8T1M7W2_CLOSI|nr:S-adenosylmethionine carrier protein [Clonorchis sinensis]